MIRYDEVTLAAGARQSYSIFGLRVESDFPLPVQPLAGSAEKSPAWRFRCCDAAALPQVPRQPLARLHLHDTDLAIRYRGGADDWVWNHSAGMFHIRWDDQVVDVYLEPDTDVERVGLLLAGQIAVLILRQMGVPALHASAVITEYGAVGFLGTHGQGKSTMAASFLRRGATLLTDDALPLRLTSGGVMGGPAVPIMKVWEDSLQQTLQHHGELPTVMPGLGKRLFRLGEDQRFSYEAAPLRALYLLCRYDAEASGRSDVSIRDLNRREELVTLCEHTSGRVLMSPQEQAGLFPFYGRVLERVQVRLLMYPHGYEHQDRTFQAVLQEAAGR